MMAGRRHDAQILAPAGSPEALEAAVRAGADAVYLGGKSLNARVRAGNFDDEQLKEAVAYCHTRGVKVYLTLNTILSDSQLAEAERCLERACAIGIDALILQDIGLAALVRQAAPDMEIHASTQMSVHTRAGLRQLLDMGFSRAVLAREMSKKELEQALLEPIEIEIFVHGALCMCVSGQCYLSAMIGGRSGNHGACAQPCRLPFSVPGGTGHDLSLKDLSIVEDLRELEQMGVDSFKIEGRMKRPEYVAAAVDACFKSLEGGLDPADMDVLRTVFSRSGFTKGYLEGKLGREMFGTRRKEDAEGVSQVLRNLRQLYDSEHPRYGVTLRLTLERSRPAVLEAAANGVCVSVTSDVIPEPARRVALTAERAVEQLGKCGGTIFYPTEVTAQLDEGLSYPLSALNGLRRSAFRLLKESLNIQARVPFQQVSVRRKPYRRRGAQRLWLRIADPRQIPAVLPDAVEKIILPCHLPDEVFQRLPAGVCCVEIPRGLFGIEERIADRLRRLKALGVETAFAGTLDGVRLALECGLEVLGGFGLNICNTLALEEAARLGLSACVLSPEITVAALGRLGGGIPAGVFAYGRLPVMSVRNCPLKNGRRCIGCTPETRLITDRKGCRFPVECFKNPCNDILNCVPLRMEDKIGDLNRADFLLLYFTQETPEQAAEIVGRYTDALSGVPLTAPEGAFTRGLFYRGV